MTRGDKNQPDKGGNVGPEKTGENKGWVYIHRSVLLAILGLLVLLWLNGRAQSMHYESDLSTERYNAGVQEKYIRELETKYNQLADKYILTGGGRCSFFVPYGETKVIPNSREMITVNKDSKGNLKIHIFWPQMLERITLWPLRILGTHAKRARVETEPDYRPFVYPVGQDSRGVYFDVWILNRVKPEDQDNIVRY